MQRGEEGIRRADELLDKANRGIPLSQSETTELLNLAGVQISEARVWQLHKNAIEKLRRRPQLAGLAKHY